MGSTELSRRLRDLAKKGSTYRRTICKMASKEIDKMAAELEETKALLNRALEDLKRADIDCLKCLHKAPAAPCNNDDAETWCDDCPHECFCKDCYNNSKWEWGGKVQK